MFGKHLPDVVHHEILRLLSYLAGKEPACIYEHPVPVQNVEIVLDTVQDLADLSIRVLEPIFDLFAPGNIPQQDADLALGMRKAKQVVPASGDLAEQLTPDLLAALDYF